MKLKYSIMFFLILLFAFGQKAQYSNVERLMDSIQAYDAMSVIVTIDENGESSYFNFSGNAGYDPEIAHSINSKFKIGSITKTYTAALALLLEEEGKINLTDKLSKYYPEINGSDEITLDEMLHHRSGLINYTDQVYFGEMAFNSISKQQFIDLIKNEPLNFEPNSKYEYSNTNYLLIGYIIQDITKQPYGKILEEYITKPYQLPRTYLYDGDESTAPKSFAMKSSFPNWNSDWSAGAGGIVSTAEDVNRFYYLLFNGEIISEESLSKMMNFQDSYGMGLLEVDLKNHKQYLHSGSIEGFHSLTVYVPDKNINYTILSNENDKQIVSNKDIASAISSDIYNVEYQFPKFEDHKNIQVSEEELEKWSGIYKTEKFPLDIKIFVNEAQLYGQATGQSAFPLNYINREKAEFEFKPAGINMRFEENEEDTLMYFQQGPNQFTFKRSSINIAEEVKTKQILNKDAVEKIVGRYKSKDFPLEIQVFEKNGELYAQASGQMEFPLNIIDEKNLVFEFSPASIEMKFENEKENTIMNFEQNGNQMLFTKQ